MKRFIVITLSVVLSTCLIRAQTQQSPVAMPAPRLNAMQLAGDLTAMRADFITPAMLQWVATGLNKSGDGGIPTASTFGGEIRLPPGRIDLGKTTLYLPNGVTLAGWNQYATKINYAGNSVAIKFRPQPAGQGGYGRSANVRDLAIISKASGISIETGPGASEFNTIHITNVTMNVQGDAIDLSLPNDLTVYWPTIQNVTMEHCGGMALKGNLRGAIIDRLFFDGQGNVPVKLDVSGNGKICNSSFEDHGNQSVTAAKLTGAWDLQNNWIEWAHDPQLIFANPASWRVTQTIDRPFFVYPNQRIKLLGMIDLRYTVDAQHDWDISKFANYIDDENGQGRVFTGSQKLYGKD